MKLKRRKLLVEPPTTAAPDIAFILIVFFLICASVQPDTGRPQDIPRSEDTADKTQSQNLEILLTEETIVINGAQVPLAKLKSKVTQLLTGKDKEADRVVIVKSANATTYQRWIQATTAIEQAGGIVTLQMEQEEVSVVN